MARKVKIYQASVCDKDLGFVLFYDTSKRSMRKRIKDAGYEIKNDFTEWDGSIDEISVELTKKGVLELLEYYTPSTNNG